MVSLSIFFYLIFLFQFVTERFVSWFDKLRAF